MATSEPLEPSRRLSEAALAERERLLRQLERIDQRRANHTRQLHELDAERARLSTRMELLDELVPAQPARLHSVEPSRKEPPRGYLRGAAIRREAVRLLAESGAPEVAIHYTDWLAKLEQAGFGIESRDPAAAFLTQITRSSVVTRAEHPGTYALDLDATCRLRERLDGLHAELRALHGGQQTLEAIVSTRDRREQLLGEISRTERALEEALSTLGS